MASTIATITAIMGKLEVDTTKNPAHQGGLLGLPKEMLTHILTFVTRPQDMIGVCTVCKQMQTITLPLLYRDVHLDLLSSKPTKAIIALLSSINPGLKMIRNLTIHENQSGGGPVTGECGHLALLVLSMMPRDMLRSFSSNIKFPHDILPELRNTLVQQQRTLETLRICHLLAGAFFIEPSCSPVFSHQLRRIECSAWNYIDVSQPQPDHGSYTMRRPKLESLDLILSDLSPKGIPDPSESDVAMATSRFLEQFVPRARTGATLPQQCDVHAFETSFSSLEHLGLRAGSWGYSSTQTMCEVFNMSQLKSLTLQFCSDIAPLLSLLAVMGDRLRLEHLVIASDDIGSVPGSSTKELLDALIGSFSGLKTLVLYISTRPGHPPADTKTLSSVWAIGQHSATLEILCLDFGYEIYDPVHLHILSRLFTRLEQLSLILPPIELEDFSLPYECDDKNFAFATSLRALGELPSLKTLHIRRLPKTSWLQCHVASTDPRNKIATDYMLQDASTQCWLNAFSGRPLKVLAWGYEAYSGPGANMSWAYHGYLRPDQTHDCDGWGNLRIFIRGEKHDLSGRTTVFASVPYGKIYHSEPAVQVLDVVVPVEGLYRMW
ncbi:hypothetical protein LTR15_002750 [Elasticomyces elasticus]|nr:hypothetical protein LTR15_002750 [Elasticomyces elasticus]